jgi:hypothetical protein
MSRVLVSLWFLLAAASLVSAHMIEVMASKKECFFEDLHKHDKVCRMHISASSRHEYLQMTVTYQVGGGGHLDIDFWVSWAYACIWVPMYSCVTQLADPEERILGKQIRQSTGSISITAEKDGRHEYCFSNQMSSIADKLVR